jgi:type II restriction enzyme
MERSNINQLLKRAIRHKLQNYRPEPASMPFHTRLLGKDRMALFSFIHSLNTNFGTSIFEPVAIEIAKDRFQKVQSQAVISDVLSEAAQYEIQHIMGNLSAGVALPNKIQEVEMIRACCQQLPFRKTKLTRVDIYLQDSENNFYLFDLKTAKPNAGGFKEFKRTLLEWTAAILAENPTARVYTVIAIPYNPYEPKPYQRWTMRGMLDLEHELKVAEEFWDFLGGTGTYTELLNCFEQVGLELRTEIDEYFAKFIQLR